MKLIVTRPEPDGSALAATLRGRGHEAVLAPLMAVRPTGAVPDLGGVQALAATSANGVRALAEAGGDTVFRLPLYAVGAATAKTAAEAGFHTVHEADGDVDALVRLIAAQCDAAAGAILHAAGAVTAGDLKGDLELCGFDVRRSVLYEAVAADALPADAKAAIEAGSADGVLLYSPRTARLFADLVAAAGLTGRLSSLTAFCLSHAVADALAGAPFAACRIAPEPRGEALLALLADE